MLKRRICSLITVLAVVAGCAAPPDRSTPTPSASSTPWSWKTPEPPTPSASPLSTPLPTLDASTWASWALLDREHDNVTAVGGAAGTSTTESMIKIGVVAQYLADLEEVGRQPSFHELELMKAAIVDSDNEATEDLYRRRFGDTMLRKLLATCQLKASTTKPGWWSETQMTSIDAARLGACVAAGRVASTEWTTWILGEMRSVRGEGLFGIIAARPTDEGRPLAIKNGWTVRGDSWHVNCLAVSTFWTLAVMVRYPAGRGLAYGAGVCRDVAAAIAPVEPAPSPTAAVTT